jgi:hypothetical protein
MALEGVQWVYLVTQGDLASLGNYQLVNDKMLENFSIAWLIISL